jgi:hypothetical protein
LVIAHCLKSTWVAIISEIIGKVITLADIQWASRQLNIASALGFAFKQFFNYDLLMIIILHMQMLQHQF